MPEEEHIDVVSFLLSGLVTILNKEFQREFHSFRDDGDKIDHTSITAMAKEEGIKNPKPDRVYATRSDKYAFSGGFPTPDPDRSTPSDRY